MAIAALSKSRRYFELSLRSLEFLMEDFIEIAGEMFLVLRSVPVCEAACKISKFFWLNCGINAFY